MSSPSDPPTQELSPEQKHLALLNDPVLQALIKERYGSDATSTIKRQVKHRPSAAEEESLRKSPYYSERYALFIKPTVDAMILDREPRNFSYARFPKQKPSTLYSLVSQAFRYLINHLDDEKETYALFRGEVEICKEVTGVHIYFKTTSVDIATGEPFLADKIVAKESVSISRWKKKLYEYLEDESQIRFYEDKLALSADEMLEIQSMIDNVPTIMPFIKPSHIRLFRGTEEQVKMMKEAAALQEEG